MAIKVNGTTVINDSRALSNIASVDATTAASITAAGVGGGGTTAKAWVTFNGQGTVSIREDGNVSSITDNGTGNYTTNFSSSLSSSNYTTTGGSSDDSMHGRILTSNESPATGSRRFRIVTDANNTTDERYVYALFIV